MWGIPVSLPAGLPTVILDISGQIQLLSLDSVSGEGSVRIQGTIQIGEYPAVVSAQAKAQVAAVIALSAYADALSGQGQSLASVVAALQESPGTLSSEALSLVSAIASISEGAVQVSGDGKTIVSAGAAITEALASLASTGVILQLIDEVELVAESEYSVTLFVGPLSAPRIKIGPIMPPPEAC